MIRDGTVSLYALRPHVTEGPVHDTASLEMEISHKVGQKNQVCSEMS